MRKYTKVTTLILVLNLLSFSAVALPFGLELPFNEKDIPNTPDNLEYPDSDFYTDADLSEVSNKLNDVLEKGKATKIVFDRSKALEKAIEESGKIEFAKKVSERICLQDKKLPALSEIKANTAEDIKMSSKRLEHISKILNEKEIIDSSIPQSRFNELYENAQKISNFLPIYTSGKNLEKKACKVDENNTEESRKEFYIALLILAVDASLVMTGINYGIASKGVRTANTKFGLARIRGLCGDKCYGMVLSEVHWIQRGTLNNWKSNMLNEDYTDIGIKTDQLEKYNFEELLEIGESTISDAGEATTDVIPRGDITGGFFSGFLNVFN